MVKTSFANTKQFYLSHFLGFLYVVVTGYQLLVNEYRYGNYSFYYYESPYAHSPFKILYILPFDFWGITLCFGLLLFLCGIERNIKSLLRQTILSGLIVYLFNILLTLQSDTQYGAFYWPLQNVEFPFKAEYSQGMVYIYFFILYVYIFKCIVRGSTALGYGVTPLFYLPVLSFLFSFNPFVHAGLLLCSGSSVYLFNNSNFQINPLKAFLLRLNPCYSIIFVVIVACFFRLWTLDYFSGLGVHNIPGLAADGPMYYKQAIGFLAGESIGDLGATPSYGYLLSVFFKIVGFDLVNALTLQGIFCASIPAFIFFIARTVFNFKVALIASICSALSYQLILYSVVVQRASMAAFFLSAGIFLLTKLMQKIRMDLTLIFSFCLGWVLLLDVIMLPALLILPVALIFNAWKTKKLGKYLAIICLGILLAEISFNWIIYKNEGQVFLLGVNSTEGNWWNQAGLKEGEQLEELGFNPFVSITGSFVSLINNPMEVGGLYLKKSYKELQGYFFDHEAFYLDPVLINRESFFSSALTVYYFPILIIGGLLFFLSKKIHWQHKAILGVPIVYSVLIQMLYLHGHARYRVVVQPLILVLFAYGLYRVYQYLTQFQLAKEKNRVGFFYDRHEPDIFFKNISAKKQGLNQWGVTAVCLLTALFIFSQVKILNQPPYPLNKNILKASSHFSWRDKTNEPVSTILAAPDFEVKTEFYVATERHYNLGVKLAKEFGPSLHNIDLEFYLNDSSLGLKKVPNHSGWIFMKNVKLKTGRHKLMIKAVVTKKNHSKQIEKAPRFRNIIFRDFNISYAE